MTATDALAAAVAAADVSTKSTAETDVAFAGLSTGVLVFLAAVWSLFGHYLSARSRYLNESGTACWLGLAAGMALLACSNRTTAGLVAELLSFNSAAFFTYLLPPVIFYAGLSVEQRLFFSNLPSILSFGVLGTLVSFVLLSAALYSLAGTTFGLSAQDCLALGAVFAATDSVAVLGLLDPRSAPQLFSLVFGEGIVNDATSVLLLGALSRVAARTRAAAEGGGDDDGPGVMELVWSLAGNFGYLLLTSTCLGVAAGAGVAVLLRCGVASQGPHHEMALVGLLSYLAYLAAEVLGLSGILSLFCCGAAVSRFALRSGGGGGELPPPHHHHHRHLPQASDAGLSPHPSMDAGDADRHRGAAASGGGGGDSPAHGDAGGGGDHGLGRGLGQ
ncbi:hypothetical protein GPECTOR_119g410 [Gonium pectorale]|uniref:Cation/H+ exchanger transmembrane domain-containing protein n=1 Tax=Gonium pectorale TaxID=33097 RepID=A0A150FYW4_GONPE|nr:hypothetical protein GPECTOR_119g410 [Gonium pectorale]|eukprot:KXZ42779.1 hypothetical protein GPECTOR_119g410 [Gonium pectorale]